MPELPEVEAARKLAHATLVGRRLTEVWAAADGRVLEDRTRLLDVLEGATVLDVRRRGKVLWWVSDRPAGVLIHLGMTGRLFAPGQPPLRLQTTGRGGDASWPPRFCKLMVNARGGPLLALADPRRFGKVWVRDDPLREPPLRDLGWDPLIDPPGADAFSRSLDGRRGGLKALLLDQSFVAGIGNWVADEVLHLAHLDPRRSVDSVSVRERTRLYAALMEVVQIAVSVDADASAFPAEWLFHRRWTPRVPAEIDGAPVVFEKVAGRTTAWVPEHQR